MCPKAEMKRLTLPRMFGPKDCSVGRRLFGNRFEKKLNRFKTIWNNLEQSGTIWNNLEQSGTIWNNLEQSETIWAQRGKITGASQGLLGRTSLRIFTPCLMATFSLTLPESLTLPMTPANRELPSQ
jgi:hypothetical protein